MDYQTYCTVLDEVYNNTRGLCTPKRCLLITLFWGEAYGHMEGLWTPQSLLLIMEIQRRTVDSHIYCTIIKGRPEASTARYLILQETWGLQSPLCKLNYVAYTSEEAYGLLSNICSSLKHVVPRGLEKWGDMPPHPSPNYTHGFKPSLSDGWQYSHLKTGCHLHAEVYVPDVIP